MRIRTRLSKAPPGIFKLFAKKGGKQFFYVFVCWTEMVMNKALQHPLREREREPEEGL